MHPAGERYCAGAYPGVGWETFRQFSDKGRSFTDCSSKVVMERLGITQAFAFDQHFRQFGSVTVVP